MSALLGLVIEVLGMCLFTLLEFIAFVLDVVALFTRQRKRRPTISGVMVVSFALFALTTIASLFVKGQPWLEIGVRVLEIAATAVGIGLLNFLVLIDTIEEHRERQAKLNTT